MEWSRDNVNESSDSPAGGSHPVAIPAAGRGDRFEVIMRAKNGHLLKTENLVRSEKWRKLPKPGDFERLVYCLLVGAVDSWGMMPADPCTLKSELDPVAGTHTPEEYVQVVQELTKIGLLCSWSHQDCPWLCVFGHDEAQKAGIRNRKSTPEVPRMDLDPSSTDLDPTTPILRRDERETEVEVEGEKEGNPPSPPSTSIPSIGNVLPGLMDRGTFATSPSLLPRSEPPTAQCVTLDEEADRILNELRQHHAQVGGYEARGFVRLDEHAERIAQVLAEYGQAGCEQIQRGHLIKSDENGGKFRSWPHAYPAVEGDRCIPDWDWIAEHHKAGEAKKAGSGSGWTPGSTPPGEEVRVECPGCRACKPLSLRGTECEQCGVHIGLDAREGTISELRESLVEDGRELEGAGHHAETGGEGC